jgi:hypothetical protein
MNAARLARPKSGNPERGRRLGVFCTALTRRYGLRRSMAAGRVLGVYLDRHRFRLVASGENAGPVAQHHQPVRMVRNRARVKRTRRVESIIAVKIVAISPPSLQSSILLDGRVFAAACRSTRRRPIGSQSSLSIANAALVTLTPVPNSNAVRRVLHPVGLSVDEQNV